MTPQHLIIAPILIPLVAGAAMLMYDERRRRFKLGLGLAACVLQVVVAAALVLQAKGSAAAGGLSLVHI